MPAPTIAAFTVPSRTRTGLVHTVSFDGQTWACSCEWGQRRRPEQRQCWHVEAVVSEAVRRFAWTYYADSAPELHRDYYEREMGKMGTRAIAA